MMHSSFFASFRSAPSRLYIVAVINKEWVGKIISSVERKSVNPITKKLGVADYFSSCITDSESSESSSGFMR